MLRQFVVVCVVLAIGRQTSAQYEPTWESLDKRPLPGWYDEAKIGIFLHWGVFSVPSFNSEWFWANWKSGNKEVNEFIDNNYPPGFSYQEYAKEFTAEFFNASEWASIFRKSGARYVVLTSKHHEGYTLWPSRYSFSWNAKDIGPHKDLIGELSKAVRDEGLIFGCYHSLYEWFNPMYLADKANNYTTQEFVDNKIIPEMKELVTAYNLSVLWSDGDWEAPDTYWRATEFLAWLFNESPVQKEIVVNDRWGSGIPCKHGDFYTCQDRYNPGTLQSHKWENAMTVDKTSWGFRRNSKLSDYLSTHELLVTLAETVSCGGNMLINVGPTKDGMIAPIFEERLLQLGEWLDVNGEAIYASKPWTVQNDTLQSGVWYTQNDNSVYGIVLSWPEDNTLVLGSVSDVLSSNDVPVRLLGDSGKLKWSRDDSAGTVAIQFPDKATVKSENAWVIKIET